MLTATPEQAAGLAGANRGSNKSSKTRSTLGIPEGKARSRVSKPDAATPHSTCLIPENGLPPVILSTGVKGDYSIEENPDQEKIITQIRNGKHNLLL